MGDDVTTTDTRAKRVYALLAETHHKACWEYTSKSPEFKLRCFVGPAGVLLVQEWPINSGVEVYAPIVTNNSMQDLVDEIRRRSAS